MTMSYHVGSLSALLSSPASDAVNDVTTKDGGLKGLFESRSTLPKPSLQQEPEVKEEVKVEEGPKSKKTKGGKKKKSKKALKSDQSAGGDIDEEEGFKTPSRNFQVKAEANKERKHDPEKEIRTVFVGNLPSNVNVKAIKRKFKEYGDVETVRLRSAARPDLKTTKRTAVITRNIHENRNNINAYVRFKDKECAIKSCQLNGSEFDSHVIRVDMAMKPPPTAADGNDPQQPQTTSQHDQSKSIFLGNLHYGIQEDQVRQHFRDCGEILDVRLIRDSFTGIGKGFGYVTFKSSDSIELGLKLNRTQLEGRDVRVSRSTNKPKQKMVQKVKPTRVKPVLGDKAQNPNRVPVNSNAKKFVKKPKVDFQGKVGLKTREVRDKKKAAKKAKRAEMKKLSLHSRAESRKLKAQSKSG